MGMVMYLRRIDPSDIARLLAEPDDAEKYVFSDEYSPDDPTLVEFDKAWQAVHFLLTGTAYGAGDPLGIIAGDLPRIGEADLGRADAWLVTPEAMAAFAGALGQVDDDTLRRRFDLDAMLREDVYIADALAGDDEAIDYIMQGVPALRRLADDCAAAGDGAVRLLA